MPSGGTSLEISEENEVEEDQSKLVSVDSDTTSTRHKEERVAAITRALKCRTLGAILQ